MLHLKIEHHTRYLYEKPVSFSPHILRIFPRGEPGRMVRALSLKTDDGARVRYRRDLFDNIIARCNYPGLSAELIFDFTVELHIEEYNCFDFLLENYAAEFPFSYEESERRRLSLYIDSEQPALAPLLPLPFWSRPIGEKCSTVSMLVDLVGSLHEHIVYERRDTGHARPPAETVALGMGACRDVAVLLAAILRELGLAARLVSGYLCELSTEEGKRVAESAMHAWTEVYLPGAGWLGLDPTNGIFCNHNHIATAVGLTPADITPITGSYYGKEIVTDKMTSDLRLTAV